MKILFIKSKWEMWNESLILFIERVIKDKFDGTELYLDSVPESNNEINNIHETNGLFLLGQILTDGKNISEHIDSFNRQADFALEAGSKLVNVHAGRDYFSFEDNLKLIEHINQFSRKCGIEFLIETHRGRLTYSLIDTIKYLEASPELKLTADFSHWMVVHESDLSNQSISLGKAIDRSFHIHARVGYEEGPQVTDPAAPEWSGHLSNHLNIWEKIIDKRKKEGREFFTITPEFGPPNYMHTLPFSKKPIRDAWEMNLKMRDIIKTHIHI
ncbi:hypothetical protein ASZ90_004417 [hydrocarbon metagenome]|uniref:Xylose isomerase-like TIM barrel domain-containing protein n=1 Tax=hydrocarbon metagenome TaxID=938273 RepID=A0A0W8FXT4_9ZZZZ